ncbi:MAG: hypothetical protein SFY69_01835 [Planctomycetota bacterium]|nr:hypothetical protein [Planctomycetota bacterium]
MPPIPRQPCAALLELESQVRFAPREARRRLIENAETLCTTLEPLAPCSHARLVEGVTGFRPDGHDDRPLDGREVVAGLGAFVERQCHAARMLASEAPGALDVPALLARWSISRATLGRLRRQGLPARRVLDAHGRSRAVFMPHVVESFEARHGALLARAGAYERISPPEAARLLRRAARYHRLLGWSRTRIARHLSLRTGRSVEGIRALLLRGAGEVFRGVARLSARERALLFRAARLGIDLGTLARRVQRSRASVRHAINVERARRLRELASSGALAHADHAPARPTRDTADPLALPGVGADLGAGGQAPLADVLALAADRTPARPSLERARGLALQFLRARAAGAIAPLDDDHPRAEALDAIETDLRWAARLKAELVRGELTLIVRVLDARLPGGLASLPVASMQRVLLEAIDAAAAGVDAFDPGRGGRLAGPVGLAVDRVGVRWARGVHAAPQRARPVLGPDVRLPDWTRALCPWQRWLEPPARVRDWALGAPANDPHAAFLRARFGWSGPPRTLRALCAELGIRPTRAPILESEALRHAARAGTR